MDSQHKIPSSTVEQLAAALKKAHRHGYQIVPIVGAGLSADCGFPVIMAVVRYFGKLYRYIEERVPLPRGAGVPKIDVLDEYFKRYLREPWRFVEDFGWPDRFQLNQDLFTTLSSNPSKGENCDGEAGPEKIIEQAVREGLERMLPFINPQGSWAYNTLRREIDAIVGTADSQVRVQNRFDETGSKSAAFDVIGDWRRLILYFTNFHSDYADGLFARFGATRQPGQGHRFLAFLVKLLAIPTIFTFNFDSLIEQALQSEGAGPRTFAMERGASLPHPRLVRDQLSVIKMHGSTHALLVDEQLDRPLSDSYLKRFDRITGPNPLLLVVGCSDGDRRLRDLVAHVVARSRENAASQTRKTPAVLWLYYETKAPGFLETLEPANTEPSSILISPTNNPGATLQHLHSWLTSYNPAGRIPYLTHIQQPVPRRDFEREKRDSPQKICFEVIHKESEIWDQRDHISTSSHELLNRANHWARNGHHFIWIDLEALHTFAGVVGSIIDQCRKYDPDLAPSMMPVNIDRIDSEKDSEFLARTIDLAAARVARALRRTRYYVAFDSLEKYVCPATTHHGLTHMTVQRGARFRLRNLVDFLVQLKKRNDLGESLIGLSVDNLTSRYGSRDLGGSISLEEQVQRLADLPNLKLTEPESDLENYFEDLNEELPLIALKRLPEGVLRILSGDEKCKSAERELKARFALVMLNLSCFRRTRPLVAMRHLLRPIIGCESQNDRPDRILNEFTKPQLDGIVFLQQLEGGGFWFNHSIRDYVYTENTRFTNTQQMKKCLERGATEEAREERVGGCQKSAFQLTLGALTHRRIARTWYTHTFVQSQDTFAFLEYTYHRISAIRNLVKLRALTHVSLEDDMVAQAVIEGIAQCGKLVCLIDKTNSLADELEFWDEPVFDDLLRNAPRSFPPRPAVEVITDIERALSARHHSDLQSLYRAWTRAESALLKQIPAEQLLHWCEELITDDLKHRCNRVVIGYDKNNPPDFRPEYYAFGAAEDADLRDRQLEEKEITQFRRFLQDLQVKLWIERSDYQTTIGARRVHLLERAPKRDQPKWREKYPLSPEMALTEHEIEKDPDFIARCDASQCHLLLDIVNSKLKLVQEETFDDSSLTQGVAEPLELLEMIEACLKSLAPTSADEEDSQVVHTNNLNEAWLRLLHMRTDCYLAHVSMFSHDGIFCDSVKVPESVRLEQARKTIREGLKNISERDAHLHQAPRSVVLDPTTDGALYPQYRSIFHLLQGRTKWLCGDESAEEEFQRSSTSFEMARGLGDRSKLMSALIELYAVEASLGRARQVLFDGTSSNSCELAYPIYELARTGLQRARQSLLMTRGHAIWRKLFSRLATQYHADRLLLGYAKLERKQAELQKEPAEAKGERVRPRISYYDPDSWEEMSRQSLLRLRRAYQSLLTALDLYLPRSRQSEFPNRFRWLYRMWWELTLCGYATGRLAVKYFTPKNIIDDQNITDDDGDKYGRSLLEWLNKADGIFSSELGDFVKDKISILDDLYNRIRSHPHEIGLDLALSRRRKLMQEAWNQAYIIRNEKRP